MNRIALSIPLLFLSLFTLTGAPKRTAYRVCIKKDTYITVLDPVYHPARTLSGRRLKEQPLAEGTLYEPASFTVGAYTVPVAKGTRVHLDREGNLLPAELVLKSVINRNTMGSDDLLELDPTYFFKHAVHILAERRTIITLASNTFFRVGTNRLMFQAGKPLFFYRSGAIAAGTIAKGTHPTLSLSYYSLTFEPETRLYFYQDGSIMAGVPGNDVVLERNAEEKLLLSEDANVLFYRNGTVFLAELAVDTPVRVGENKIVFTAGATVAFYRDRAFMGGTLTYATNILIHGRSIRIRPPVDPAALYFFRTGFPKFVLPAEETMWEIGGYLVPVSSSLFFYESGKAMLADFKNPVYKRVNGASWVEDEAKKGDMLYSVFPPHKDAEAYFIDSTRYSQELPYYEQGRRAYLTLERLVLFLLEMYNPWKEFEEDLHAPYEPKKTTSSSNRVTSLGYEGAER